MEMSARELWTVVHGMLFGAIFLMAFAGGLTELWVLRAEPQAGSLLGKLTRLRVGLWTMTITSWATVITGTFLVYPWYREKIPTSPRSLLLADPGKAAWHTFGMEWKEHISWTSPILTTVVLFIVLSYGTSLARKPELRNALLVLYVLAFFGAGVAGVFGAFINKIGPIN